MPFTQTIVDFFATALGARVGVGEGAVATSTFEMFSENLYDSFILNEYDEKVSVFMSNENKEHLFNLDGSTGASGQEMGITLNNNEEYFEDDDEEDEFTSKIIAELKRQLKPPTLDQLLDKINEKGYNVLSNFEKGILENYSKN